MGTVQCERIWGILNLPFYLTCIWITCTGVQKNLFALQQENILGSTASPFDVQQRYPQQYCQPLCCTGRIFLLVLQVFMLYSKDILSSTACLCAVHQTYTQQYCQSLCCTVQISSVVLPVSVLYSKDILSSTASLLAVQQGYSQ